MLSMYWCIFFCISSVFYSQILISIWSNGNLRPTVYLSTLMFTNLRIWFSVFEDDSIDGTIIYWKMNFIFVSAWLYTLLPSITSANVLLWNFLSVSNYPPPIWRGILFWRLSARQALSFPSHNSTAATGI